MSNYRKALEAAKKRGQQQADAWNAAHPVGTRVIAYPGVRPEDPIALKYQERLKAGRVYGAESDPTERLVTTTRTPAWVIGGGEPVVSVHGYAGGICLDHVDIDLDSPLGDGEILAHTLTVGNLARFDDWLDACGIYAKGYWENVDGKLTVTGLRIGTGADRVVARYGDTIIRRADGSFTVRTVVAW